MGPEHTARSPGALEEAARWLRYAQDDAASARLLIEVPEAPPRHASFHAQQAAEKALKAILVAEARAFPHTHDLVQLCELVPPTWAVLQVEVRWAALSDHAVDARYPDDLPDVSAVEAEAAVEDAERVVEAVAAELAPLLGGA